jgi:UDP-2,3-diacylglucosamine pyrophosphatase LpxH
MRFSPEELARAVEVIRAHPTVRAAAPHVSKAIGRRVTADAIGKALKKRGVVAMHEVGRDRDIDIPIHFEPDPPVGVLEDTDVVPQRINEAFCRVIIPDSHGEHIDKPARDACIADVRRLQPLEVVLLGDHLDCAGTFSAHQRSYTNEMAESYTSDVAATNEFLDMLQDAAPAADIYYLEGNHEQHVERWAAREIANQKDADMALEKLGPRTVLRLDQRGIRYFQRSTQYMGLSIPGAIKLGKCYFVHGISHAKSAAAVHLARFGANVVFGHVHTPQGITQRTVTAEGIGAWCPGTLARLQPLYAHTAPSSWAHGYAIQHVQADGSFLHINVAILGGRSLLP